MINRDSRGHQYSIVRGEILGFTKDELLRKHLPRMFSLISERKLGDRRRLISGRRERENTSLVRPGNTVKLPGLLKGCCHSPPLETVAACNSAQHDQARLRNR